MCTIDCLGVPCWALAASDSRSSGITVVTRGNVTDGPRRSAPRCWRCSSLRVGACVLPAISKACLKQRKQTALFVLHHWQRVQQGLERERGCHTRLPAAAGGAQPPPSNSELL